MAGYNTYFPTAAYQPMMPQQTFQQTNQAGINWVQGIAGAKAWMVAPGQTAFLMDSEGQTFYIKSADQSGMPTLKVYDFRERQMQTPEAERQRDALAELAKRVAALEAKVTPSAEVASDE